MSCGVGGFGVIVVTLVWFEFLNWWLLFDIVCVLLRSDVCLRRLLIVLLLL